ncbi:hypothetical protein LWI28_024320 [Acer negundo]|uniref:non-specific serine/threonine protein kinase n=1 Tax=Acer negundo TaxID=4023 RepID=A0AAD5NM77_ACENE|nr:hypothetical protein LWI28_024320 [Acer negundo]
MAVKETGEEAQEKPLKEGKLEHGKREKTQDMISPRGVLEIPVLGTDSDSSSSNSSSCSSTTEKLTPITTTTTGNREGNNNYYGLQWKNMIDAIKKKSVRRFSVIPLLTNYDLSKKNLWKKLARVQSSEDEVDIEIPFTRPSWKNFEYSELAAATDNFSSENLIGKGGHAEVYKGYLSNGQFVAVKRLIKDEKEEEDRVGNFLSELGIIAHINHPNAARLIGFSTESGLHLVLQFLPNGSLAALLHGSAECLEWKIRFKIAVGVADGLQYLHHDCHRRIIHRDITASNILLTEDYEAQISDFGLAKWLPENWPHHVVFPIEGTFGYLAPEYFMHGIADEKTDVFSFGVLLLEIITGRRAVDNSQQSLVMWAKQLDTSNVKEIVDPRLGDTYDPIEMGRATLTASLCIHHLPTMRPHMNQVVKLLRGEDGYADLKHKPSSRRTVILDGNDLQDYTCSNYLNDLNRHMELVLE